MDYFWKENKKYLIAVAAGILFTFLFNMFVLSPLRTGAKTAARNLSIEQKNLEAKMAAGVPTEETLVRARREVERARQQLTALKDDHAMKVPERFLKSEGGSARTHFDSLRLDLHTQLREAGKFAAFPADFKLGGGGDELSEEAARENLLRLAVIERLVKAAIAAKVARIDLIDGMHGTDRREETVTKKGAFLNSYSVLMKFKGESQAVFRLLHAVQQKGSYLAVTHFEATREDQTKDLLAGAIAVSLLRIDEKAPIEPKPEENP